MTYDILRISRSSRVIVSVWGTNLPSMADGPFDLTAEERLWEAQTKESDEHTAKVAEAGKFKLGDVLPEEAEQTL